MCDFVKAEKLAGITVPVVTGCNKVSDQAWQWLLKFIWGQETFTPSDGSLHAAWSLGSLDERIELLSGITGDWSRAGEMGLAEFNNHVYARLLIENPRLAINGKYGCELIQLDPSDPREDCDADCWHSWMYHLEMEEFFEVANSSYGAEFGVITAVGLFNLELGYNYHLSLAMYFCMEDEPEENVISYDLLDKHGIVLTPAEYTTLMAQYYSYIWRDM